jgi:sugar phosphate isomerase/epimerase
MLYGVRADLEKDLPATIRAVAKLGFEGVEFFGPYFYWTPAYAKEVRSVLDDAGIRCFATHNESPAFTPDGFTRAIELNQILGAESIIAVRGLVSGTGNSAYKGFEGAGLDGWKRLADRLGQACDRVRPLKMTCAYHHHAVEFLPVEGARPIDILAGVKGLLFELDTGLVGQGEKGSIDFLERHPGRVPYLLLSDWPKTAQGNQPLLGEGKEPWKQTLAAAERAGDVHFYLIQQETSDLPPMQALQKDLESFRKLHG